MPGSQPGLTPPPEVPDDFAVAYREAYERAILDQTDGPRHRRPPQYRPGYPLAEPHSAAQVDPVVAKQPRPGPVGRAAPDVELPERRGRLIVGSHRNDADALGGHDPWFDHVRESRLFVPVLLLALALLLVLGAYVLGRAFTAAVGGG